MKFDNVKCEKEHLTFIDRVRELIKKCKLNFYIAKDFEFIFEVLKYPFRLVAATDLYNLDKEKRPTTIKLNKVKELYKPESLILDSAIMNDNITNEHLLKLANILRPTIMVPKDYPDINGGSAHKSLRSIEKFLIIKDSYLKYEPKIMIPLHPPYRVMYPIIKEHDYFGISGISLAVSRRKRELQSIIKRYPEKKFHIFGTAPSKMTSFLKENDNIISCDTAIAKQFIFQGVIAKGEYSGLPERMYYLFFILNELVIYHNFEIPKSRQQNLLSAVAEVLPVEAPEPEPVLVSTSPYKHEKVEFRDLGDDW